MRIRFLLLTFYLLCSTFTFAQTYGKIFTKDEANILYGNVLQSVTVKVTDLNPILGQTQNVVMFKIMNGQLVLLGDHRKVISSISQSISDSEVFALYNKSIFLELLNYGDSPVVIFEQRSSRPTITYGSHTLEESGLCPPFCD